MPAQFLRRLTGRERTRRANRQLGLILAFVAGGINAGGFLAVHRYTSHMTGIVTDLGIELGRLLYWNRSEQANAQHFVRANRDRLRVHAAVLFAFLGGGITGAAAFKSLGFSAAVPFAMVLVAMALLPVLDDLRGLGATGSAS